MNKQLNGSTEVFPPTRPYILTTPFEPARTLSPGQQAIGPHSYRNFGLNDVALGDSAGGTTPYVVTWLTSETGNKLAPAYYDLAPRSVAPDILTIRETRRRSLCKV